MANNDLHKVADVLFGMQAVPVTFHLPNGEKVEAVAIGWEMRTGAPARALVTILQKKEKD
jgi:hypothetical protein